MMLRNSAATFCGRTVEEQEPGCELGITRACVHVRVDRVDHVPECLLRDPVRRGVRTRAGAESVVHEGVLGRSSPHRQSVSTCRLLVFAASVTVTKAREAKNMGWLPLFWSTHARLMGQ